MVPSSFHRKTDWSKLSFSPLQSPPPLHFAPLRSGRCPRPIGLDRSLGREAFAPRGAAGGHEDVAPGELHRGLDGERLVCWGLEAVRQFSKICSLDMVEGVDTGFNWHKGGSTEGEASFINLFSSQCLDSFTKCILLSLDILQKRTPHTPFEKSRY